MKRTLDALSRWRRSPARAPQQPRQIPERGDGVRGSVLVSLRERVHLSEAAHAGQNCPRAKGRGGDMYRSRGGGICRPRHAPLSPSSVDPRPPEFPKSMSVSSLSPTMHVLGRSRPPGLAAATQSSSPCAGLPATTSGARPEPASSAAMTAKAVGEGVGAVGCEPHPPRLAQRHTYPRHRLAQAGACRGTSGLCSWRQSALRGDT